MHITITFMHIISVTAEYTIKPAVVLEGDKWFTLLIHNNNTKNKEKQYVHTVYWIFYDKLHYAISWSVVDCYTEITWEAA